MSFNKYYDKRGYQFNTSQIDRFITSQDDQNSYCSHWTERYKRAFSGATPDDIGEWFIRSHKSMLEIIASATLLSEAKYGLYNNCYVSYYFSLYYALFHAMSSLLYLSPDYTLDELFNVSHIGLLNRFKSSYVGKGRMFNESIVDQFELLKYRREYYSYNSPMNSVFSGMQRHLIGTSIFIESICQTAALHAFIAARNSSRCKFNELSDTGAYHDLFNKFFSNVDSVQLRTQLKRLKADKRNAQARLRRRTIKRDKIQSAIKSGSVSLSKREINLVFGLVAETEREIVEINKKITKVTNRLDSVVLDPSAEFVRRELSNKHTFIGIEVFQFEIDHIFDEYHGYDHMNNKPAKTFDPMEPIRFIMNSLM